MTHYEMIIPKHKTEGYGVKATKIIKDISKNYNAVKNLVDTCNRCDVDLDIFPDILENYLNDFSF